MARGEADSNKERNREVMEFGLVVAELAGQEVAQAIQLGIEYDPSPPFDAGHPDKASEAAIALMLHRNEKARAGLAQALGHQALGHPA